MATLKIAFRDGKFIYHNGVKVTSFSEKSMEGNGWNCKVDSVGKFSCAAVYMNGNIKHQVKLILDTGGLVKTKWREERNRPRYKWIKLKKTPAEGIIMLPSASAVMKNPKFLECSVTEFAEE